VSSGDNGLVKPTHFHGREPIRVPPRIQSRVPQRFARINIAKSRDFELVGEKQLHRKTRIFQNCRECRRRELVRKNIHAKFAKRRRSCNALVPIHSTQMPLVHKAEIYSIKREQNIDMDAARRRVEQQYLTVKLKMESQNSARQSQN
jgi:hypothetical protein